MMATRRPEHESLRHVARVLIAEARRRRGNWFAATLLQWAKNTRNRANAVHPRRSNLFGWSDA